MHFNAIFSGLTVNQISTLLKDPGRFSLDLLKWAGEQEILLKPEEVAAFLQAKLTPERVRVIEESNGIVLQ